MASDLQRGVDALDQAIRALKRAKEACDPNERLRCIHAGRQLAQDAHDLIVGWRTGQAPRPANEEADPATNGSRQG